MQYSPGVYMPTANNDGQSAEATSLSFLLRFKTYRSKLCFDLNSQPSSKNIKLLTLVEAPGGRLDCISTSPGMCKTTTSDPMAYYGTAPEWAAVLYEPGDALGYCAAVASLIPPAFCIAHMAVFLARRDAQDLWFSVGQVVCELLNQVIKHILRIPRPSSPVLNMPDDTFGMPSAHSQFMGYVVGYTLLEVLGAKTATLERVGHFVLVSVLAVMVCGSRWYLWYHSLAQVVAGFSFGFCLGAVWHFASRPLRRLGVVNWLLDLWPCQLLKVKDTSYDVTQEWQEWRQQRAKKSL